jgi:hypothetical protein
MVQKIAADSVWSQIEAYDPFSERSIDDLKIIAGDSVPTKYGEEEKTRLLK